MLVLFANLDLVLTTLALIGAIAGGAFFLYWAKHWRQRTFGRTLEPADDLSNFRTLYEQGLLTRTEFERIVHSVAQRAAAQAEEAKKVRSSSTNQRQRERGG